ncbi:hypothetical protein ACWERV_20845 [Streptomyces sp. NPDC004031]
MPAYVCPLDHGYVDGTDGGDGSGIDVRLGTPAARGPRRFL